MVYSNKKKNQKDLYMIRILQTRAWIIHSAYTFARLIYWATGSAIWLSESRACSSLDSEASQEDRTDVKDCVPYEFNSELVEFLRP